MLLPFRDHTHVRLVSARTGETLIELKMIGSGVIVWGQHYRPRESDVRLAEDSGNGDGRTSIGSLTGHGIQPTIGQAPDACSARWMCVCR